VRWLASALPIAPSVRKVRFGPREHHSGFAPSESTTQRAINQHDRSPERGNVRVAFVCNRRKFMSKPGTAASAAKSRRPRFKREYGDWKLYRERFCLAPTDEIDLRYGRRDP